MSAGTRIQNKIKRGLEKAGRKTGAGPLLCTIKRADPNSSDAPKTPQEAMYVPDTPFTLHEVTAIEDMREVRDMNGMLTGVTKRTLTVSATGIAPLKSDTIAVGVAKADATAQTDYEEILAVRPTAPGGVALLYELDVSA